MIRQAFERIARGLFGVSFGAPGADTYEYARAWDRGLILGDPHSLDKPYASCAAIATGVSICAEDGAGIPWELYPQAGGDRENPIEDHPLLDFLAKPSPTMSGYQLFVGSYVSYKLFGEAWWYYPGLHLGTGNSGLPATAGLRMGEMSLLDPRKVKRKGDSWVLAINGREVPLMSEFLTGFLRFNPYDPVRGLSEIEAILIEAEGDYAAARFNRGFFKERSGISGGVFLPGQDSGTSSTERKDFEKRLNLRQVAMRKNFMVAPPGWDLKEFGVTQRDMEFRALREYSREQIFGMIGLPPFYAGVLDKANYANAREQKHVYWQGTITRLLTCFQSQINSDMLPKIGLSGVELWPAWEKVKATVENLNEKVDVAGKLFAMGFTKRQINERLELGMDVDELPDADVGYLPFSVTPVTFVLEPPTPMLPAEDDEDDDDEEEAKGLARESLRSLIWRNIIVRTRDLERRFDRTLRSHFAKIERQALEYADSLKAWSAKETFKADGEISIEIFDLEESKRELVKATKPIHQQSMKRGAEAIFADLGVGIDFETQNPAVAAKLGELSHKITRIDDTIEQALRGSLVEGLGEGESPQQLAARVRQTMAASKSRSFTIARTETGFAFNTGRNEGMKQAGVKRHEWLSARDSKVRDHHIAEDGQITAIGEPFPHTKLLYPLDPSGPAGEVINCRCVAIPVVE